MQHVAMIWCATQPARLIFIFTLTQTGYIMGLMEIQDNFLNKYCVRG